jgi:branched-chain amino acid transport system substrate-binding protein
VVPIAQQAKVPFVVVESGVKGVIETGNYIFRTNLPQTSYAKLMSDELKKRNVKTTAILFDEGTPTIVDLEARLQELFKEAGIDVVARETFKASDTDFSATLAKIRLQNPDALGVLAVGPANVTIVNQARQGGFTKQIWGQAGMAGGTMANAGPVANGIIFLTAFDPGFNFPSTKKFVDAYRARFNKAPTQFGAEAYDGAWLAARGIKQANSVDRDALRQGIEQVSQQGFDGAQGPLKFENRDIRAPGAVLEIKDGKEVLVGG